MKFPIYKVITVVGGLCFLWALVSLWRDEDVSYSSSVAKGSAFEANMQEPVSNPALSGQWREPLAQEKGEWVFDVFTPPVVYFDESTRTFTVKSPYDRGIDSEGLKLLKITRKPYRIQLAAYAGELGNYVVTLEDRETGNDVFCAPGETMVGLEASLRSFIVKRVVPDDLKSGQTEVFDWVGEATLFDHRSEVLVTLVSNKFTYNRNAQGVILLPSGNTISLKEGQTWTDPLKQYTLTYIDTAQQRITLEQSALDGSDKRTTILHSLENQVLINTSSIPGT